MPNKALRRLVEGGMIAAIYLALTLLSRFLGIADGAIQFRLSEALTILPVFTPAAVPGLTIGCFFANLGSPYGIVDILSGTLATLFAAMLTRCLRHIQYKEIPFLAPLPPIITNGLIVGIVVTIMNEAGALIPANFTFAAFIACAVSVAVGELAVCVGLGLPFLIALKKSGACAHIFPSKTI